MIKAVNTSQNLRNLRIQSISATVCFAAKCCEFD